MNTSCAWRMYATLLVSFSLCAMVLGDSFTKEQLMDQQLKAEKEQALLDNIEAKKAAERLAAENEKAMISDEVVKINEELSSEDINAKEALAREIENNKVIKEMATPIVTKDVATPITSVQPVELTKVEEAVYDNNDKPLTNPKLEDYINQGLGRVENNTILDGTGSRDGSVTLVGADAYGDGWNGNEICIDGAGCFAVEGSEGSWDLGVMASGDYAVTCDGGSWQSEVSWSLIGADGSTLLSGGAPFSGTLTVGDSGCADADAHSLSVGGGSWGSEVGWSIDGTSYAGSVGDFSLCLANGDYTFSMTDSYGDGWNGNTATISNADGEVVASGGLDSGSEGSFDFSLGVAVVTGCTDEEAPNYNPDATVDDGSCEDGCYNLGDWGSSCAMYIQNYGYTCEEMIGYGYDCADYDECFPGECPEPDPCATAGGNPSWVGDGYCDGGNNNADCGYDGGDCCPSTCVDGSYSCDTYGGDCDTCLDPDATDGYDDCGVCNGSNDCADCAGVPNGDSFTDCAGTCIAGSYVSWIGDGYCDDGSWGVDFVSCGDFNCDNGDCGTELLEDGTCGTPDPNDCAGVPGGDSFEDCAGTCLSAGYLSWVGDGYCDDGAWGVDFVSCGDFNCDNGDCGTELLDDGTCGTPATCSDYTIVCDGGSWQSEVSWDLDGGALTGGAPFSGSACLEDGDHSLSMVDAYGDGWNGNVWSATDADGNVIANCTLTSGDAGTCEFTTGGDAPVFGCMDENSENYNPDADTEDGSCVPYPGMDCCYFGYCEDAGYYNYTVDCSGQYCYDWSVYDGDGICDSYLNCDALGCDSGACEQNADPDGDCYAEPEACENTECVLTMVDAYGDGWNGNVWSSGDQSATLSSGTDGTALFCFDMAAANGYTCDGGSWQSEVSWTLDCADGTSVSGGAPAAGCFGYCEAGGCMDETACNYDADATFDDGSCEYPGCTGECDGSVVDACGECNGDGSACAGCAYPQWYDDQYCDSSNNTAECGYDGGDCCPGDCPEGGFNNPGSYSCEVNGGDCEDCIDPDSADNAEGGECADVVMCEDPDAYNYGSMGDCVYVPEGWTCPESYAFDSWCDCGCGAYDSTCDDPYASQWDNCGELGCVDPTSPDCNEADAWDATITGLTAEGADYYGYAAVQWDWDDLDDGTTATCADTGCGYWLNYGYTCDQLSNNYGYDCSICEEEGACGGGEVDCDADWADCLASLADYDYANGTNWATECAECADTCAGNPDVPNLTDACYAAAYNIGSGACPDPCGGGSAECDEGYLEDCSGDGDCCPEGWVGDGYGDCEDQAWGCDLTCYDNDGGDCDAAECGNGDCEAGEDNTTCPDDCASNADCAASLTISGSGDLDGDGYADDCYTDGSGYFFFEWDGGCLATNLWYDNGEGEQSMDLSAYGFTSGFYFYGFGLSQEVPFIMSFGDVDADIIVATTDCAEQASCADLGMWDCGDGQCIPESYVCDGSNEFCNATWGPDCANGADEGLEFCGYEDECDGEQTCADTGCGYWLNYGYTCDQLSNNYGYDCSLCEEEGACGGGEPECGSYDCVGTCADGYESWQGDGYCDDGSWGIDFMCEEWNFDNGDCDGRSASSSKANILSTDNNFNMKKYSKVIAGHKHSQMKTPIANALMPLASTTLNIATGEIRTLGEGNGNRVVSYTINVSCDACLDGGAWSGSWDVPQSDFLVYGFDLGADVCATVSGFSTELGATEDSEAACAAAGPAEDPCETYDCTGEACADDYLSWIGDGYCDDGSWGIDFVSCGDFDCDGGDCGTELVDGECVEVPSCTAGDVNGDEDVNVQDIVVMVGYILDGGDAEAVEECGDANGDGAVNVQDIVVLVNTILGGRTTSDATEASLNINDGIVSLDANGFVGAVQMTLSHGAGFDIELTNKAMVADYRTNGNSTTLIIVAPESDELFTASGDFNVEEIIVANENSQVTVGMPTELTLSEAYPNPFNPSTSLSVYVPADGVVSLSVYNVMGQEVATLHSGNMTAGSHSVTWNAANMTSGMYFVRAESSAGVAVQKVMLMK